MCHIHYLRSRRNDSFDLGQASWDRNLCKHNASKAQSVPKLWVNWSLRRECGGNVPISLTCFALWLRSWWNCCLKDLSGNFDVCDGCCCELFLTLTKWFAAFFAKLVRESLGSAMQSKWGFWTSSHTRAVPFGDRCLSGIGTCCDEFREGISFDQISCCVRGWEPLNDDKHLYQDLCEF